MDIQLLINLFNDYVECWNGDRGILPVLPMKQNAKQKGEQNMYYYESVGECVSQVYKVEANNWEEAKQLAFNDMKEGDILAECPLEAVKIEENYPDYHYIDESLCTKYAKLCKGTWATKENGQEYWEPRAWYFDDKPETYLNGKGEEFNDWEKGD